MQELTNDQKAALDDMVARRMANTGETRAQAAKAIVSVLERMSRRDTTKDIQHPDGSMSFEWPED